MTTTDNQLLHRPTNSLSNLRIGSTVLYQGTAFYDTGVRLKGSFVGRNARRVGFNIEFPEEQKFRGVHSKVSVDRSTHAELGVDEILLKHAANHAGGIPSMYDDLIDFIAPTSTYTGKAALRMSGFDDIYLDSQFENGADGTMYEYEVIRWPTTTVDGKPESLKRAGGLDDPNGYANIDFRDLGNNKEAYRWTNLIVSNRTRDDYDTIIAFHRAMSVTGDAFQPAIDSVLDVDQWMRTSAYQILFGPADANYTGANIHNFRLYARPRRQNALHALGLGFRLPIGNQRRSDRRRSPRASRPSSRQSAQLLRPYAGSDRDDVQCELHEPMDATLRRAGWAELANRLTYIQRRSEFAAARVSARRSAHRLYAHDQRSSARRQLDRHCRWKRMGQCSLHSHRGQSEPLPFQWTSSGGPVADQWQVKIPVAAGERSYTLEAVDYQGRVIGQQTLTIESTVTQRPLESFLRLTEVHYNPPGADDTEFVEWSHIGLGGRDPDLDLAGVQVQIGATSSFTFPRDTKLSPGQSVVLVNNEAAFRAAFPQAASSIAGTFRGNLSNGGETLRALDSSGVLLLNWTYTDTDPWPREADGDGSSLQLVSPAQRTREELVLPQFWRAQQPTPAH